MNGCFLSYIPVRDKSPRLLAAASITLSRPLVYRSPSNASLRSYKLRDPAQDFWTCVADSRMREMQTCCTLTYGYPTETAYRTTRYFRRLPVPVLRPPTLPARRPTRPPRDFTS